MIETADIGKRKQVKNTVQINTKKTLPWYAQRTVQNGSLVKTSPPHRTVQNGSVSGTVQKGCELFAFFGTFYKERFTTVSWHMSWGCVVAHAFFHIERLS